MEADDLLIIGKKKEKDYVLLSVSLLKKFSLM